MLLKLITNNKVLASYINFRFSGAINQTTGIITSEDIIPLTKTEKDIVNYVFGDNCFVNINEKTSPQVLNRVFKCLYNSSKELLDVTNIKITNLNQLLSNPDFILGSTPTPSLTPSRTPSLTPSVTPSPTRTPPPPSITPTPSLTPSLTPSFTPSLTPSLTPSITPDPIIETP
jgi:hypothetical protein